MFFDDAKLVSQELELTLTGKECGLSERAPMCGVPYHAVETYLQKLIEKGLQGRHLRADDRPGAGQGAGRARGHPRGHARHGHRDAICWRIEGRTTSVSICLRRSLAGCALCDVSTGEFYLYQIPDARVSLADELASIAPSEIIVNDVEAFGLPACRR